MEAGRVEGLSHPLVMVDGGILVDGTAGHHLLKGKALDVLQEIDGNVVRREVEESFERPADGFLRLSGDADHQVD